jgi:hypothetical protein
MEVFLEEILNLRFVRLDGSTPVSTRQVQTSTALHRAYIHYYATTNSIALSMCCSTVLPATNIATSSMAAPMCCL